MGQCSATLLAPPNGVPTNKGERENGQFIEDVQGEYSFMKSIMSAQPCSTIGQSCTTGKFTLPDDDENRFLSVHQNERERNLVSAEDVVRILSRQTDYLLDDSDKNDDSSTKSGATASTAEGSTATNPETIETSHKENMSCFTQQGASILRRSNCAVACSDPLWKSKAGGDVNRENDVLHLTMAARMADFYENQYLKEFKGCPAPKPGGVRGIRNPKPENPVKALQSSIKKPLVELIGISKSSLNNLPGLAVTAQGSSPYKCISSATECDCDGIHVKLAEDGSSFLDLVVEGALGLQVDIGEFYTAGQRKPELVLLNHETRDVVAICTLKCQYGEQVINMFATKPRLQGQERASYKTVRWSAPLYMWSKVVVEGEFPLPVRYSIFLVNTTNGDCEKIPSYRGSHVEIGSPDIKVVGRTKGEYSHSGCCLLSLQSSPDHNLPAFLSLAISRGVDPALFVCLAAIVDEVIECSIRKLCQSKRKMERRRGFRKNSVMSLVRLDG